MSTVPMTGVAQALHQMGAQGLVADSRKLQPGQAFIAWPGYGLDARQFVAEALAGGAAACVVEAQGLEVWDFA